MKLQKIKHAGKKQGEGDMGNLSGKKFRYCVLYVPGAEQHRLKNFIGQYLSGGTGEAFIPRMELYKRGEKRAEEAPMFPGYVFLYTCLGVKEVHEILKACRARLDVPFRELALQARRLEGLDNPYALYGGPGEDDICDLSDLDEEEAEFLDVLRLGGGLLAMSRGYEENKRYHVMEGPLKAYEDKIQKVDKHNRKAFLRFEIHGRQARAGFECKPKAYWFPKEGTQIVTLSDGTEVDLAELKRSLTTKS